MGRPPGSMVACPGCGELFPTHFAKATAIEETGRCPACAPDRFR